MNDFHYEIRDDGVALITWDVPGPKMNIMSWDGFRDLDALATRAIEDPDIKGVVIHSAKPDFTGGMDLRILGGMMNDGSVERSRSIFENMMYIHGIFRRIELAGAEAGVGGKPVAIAIRGTCVGIGYEIALSCHRIFFDDGPGGRIGLPEAKVGIFPAAGGTTRLVRRLGLMDSARFILEGKLLDPGRALKANLVDEVVPADKLIDRAAEWARTAGRQATIKPWDKPGFRIPGGGPYHRDGFMLFTGASGMLNGKTKGLYPAQKAALGTIYEGLMLGFDDAIKNEAKSFTRLMQDPSPSTMIRSLFVSRKELERGARRPAEIRKKLIERVGIIGAGMMGSGIAAVTALAGMNVTLIDRNDDLVTRALNGIRTGMAKDSKRGRLDPLRADAALERITGGVDMALLAGCDMVIEAVFEDPAVKAETFGRLGNHLADDRLVFSNTSTIPISRLAESYAFPEQFAGMHFFSPVARMPLVEIIRGGNSSNLAMATAFDFVRRIRKTPIMVNDAMNFYANRCIIPYLNEAIGMVGEGIKPALVENSARQIGMPIGPLQLVDETSLDLAASIAMAARQELGPDYVASIADRVVFRMCEMGRYGRKSKCGFYQYDENGRRDSLWSGLDDEFPLQDRQPDAERVRTRLMLIQVIQAAEAYQNGILEDVREGDVGAIFGWGFAPWSGGPFSWLDNTGLSEVAVLCDRLATEHGERFAAPALLRDMASRNESFYPTSRSV